MSNNEQNIASISQTTEVAKAVVEAIKSTCSDIIGDARVVFQNLTRERDLSLESDGSAIKEIEYVDGSFVGTFKFALVYRVTCETSEERYSVATMLNNIGVTLESIADTLEFGSNNTVESIEQRTNVARRGIKDNKAEDYFCSFVLKYEHREV